MSPTPSLRRCVFDGNPTCSCPALPLLDGFWPNYLYPRLYETRANWVTRTTFRMNPPKDCGTSQKFRRPESGPSPGSHPILPTAIPLRRFPTIRNNEASSPLHSERCHRRIARLNSGFLPLCLYPELLPPCFLSLRQQSLNNPCTRSTKRKRE